MEPPADVRVIRSTRRRKTASARQVGDAVEVRVPAGLPRAEEARIVARLVARVARRSRSDEVDLAARAAVLCRRYELKRPASITWVDNQESRWGSCTPAHGTIRLSRRLAAFPSWVVDYVIVHELAHLDVGGHGPDFWAIVDRYPLTERARGFLIAKGMEADEDGAAETPAAPS